MRHGAHGPDGSLGYLIDAADRIEAVDGRWHAFAAANGAPGLTASAVLGRPLAAFIADRPTAHLSRALLAEARRGRQLSFPFRCDAPGLRREMRMVLSPEPRGRVWCATTLVSARAVPNRPAGAGVPRPDRHVTMCSWCNRIRLDGRWRDLADAIGEARLFLTPAASEISHGLCDRCESTLDPESGLMLA